VSELSALERIHDPHRGFVAEDFSTLKPNTALVEPVEGPESIGAIVVPGSSLGPRACRVLYRVVAVGPFLPHTLAPGESAPRLNAGDVVLPRNGMFDPVGPNLFSIGLQHVLATIAPSVTDAPNDPEPKNPIGGVVELAA
jgi:hypothetical protein